MSGYNKPAKISDKIDISDLEGFTPKFIVASNFPRRIIGEVRIVPDGKSEVVYKVYRISGQNGLVGDGGQEPELETHDINRALICYNGLK
jgi:hypothetical protein